MDKIKMPFNGKYPMTQDYGVKVSYMRCGYHTGIDWGLPKGTPLLAVFKGKVIKAAPWQLDSYGREIQIKRADGLIAQYGHCTDILVKVGTEVEEGTILGHSGNTGYVISLGGGGYHLHFGVMINGGWFDPKLIIDGMSLPINFKPATPEAEYPKITEPVKVPVVDKNPKTEEYTVQKGDTLTKIAKMVFKNGNRWQEIYDINKEVIANPNKIGVGMKIQIPKQ
jgi:LysM repeat protein